MSKENFQEDFQEAWRNIAEDYFKTWPESLIRKQNLKKLRIFFFLLSVGAISDSISSETALKMT